MAKEVYNYEYQLQSLLRDKQLTSNIVESYRDNLIDRLPPKEEIVQPQVVKSKSKSIWSKIFSKL